MQRRLEADRPDRTRITGLLRFGVSALLLLLTSCDPGVSLPSVNEPFQRVVVPALDCAFNVVFLPIYRDLSDCTEFVDSVVPPLPSVSPPDPPLPDLGATRVSISTTKVEGLARSYGPSISADRRYVAFTSDASNLVALDTNNARDVFVRDRTDKVTTRVSVGPLDVSGNTAANGNARSYGPSISADGRYVAFTSDASNLVAGDTNGTSDVFVNDREGITTRVSVSSTGTQANSASWSAPSISADGRYVAFTSDATNLVSGDVNASPDAFVHDRTTGATTRVSVDSGGAEANNGSYARPAVSADGRYVAFTSQASNLVSGDTNAEPDVFVRDRQTGSTTRISLGSSAAQANASSESPAISADGRYVAFTSLASNLVTGDTNAEPDVFVRDRQTSTTSRVSVDSSAVQTNASNLGPSISADGRYVAFSSEASNLVSGDTNAEPDLFVRDRQTAVTRLLSVSDGGAQASGWSADPAISADGTEVAFTSAAANLVSGDKNKVSDVFVRHS